LRDSGPLRPFFCPRDWSKTEAFVAIQTGWSGHPERFWQSAC